MVTGDTQCAVSKVQLLGADADFTTCTGMRGTVRNRDAAVLLVAALTTAVPFEVDITTD